MLQVVWFKRDLRVYDHAPLTFAAKKGPVLPLYVCEPALWAQADMSARHYHFLTQCLASLSQALTHLPLISSAHAEATKAGLVIKVGSVVQVLGSLQEKFGVFQLWSHQETWNAWTYARDIEVNRWCRQRGITWHEIRGHGVVRGLKNRDSWSKQWYVHMASQVALPPSAVTWQVEPSDSLPKAQQLGLCKDYTVLQSGGRSCAMALLESFLHTRGETYTKSMSSPLSGAEACSRLSAHFAFGTLSIREAFQAASKRYATLKSMSKEAQGTWPSAMRSFLGRLRWHCHFMQKLEDEPGIEFENMHPAYDQIRCDRPDPRLLEAWKAGKTGYPMVDACMRSLRATGWLNFRMRAMLMSFASYHLWMHWREPALYLATQFTDYEPGIHYSQVQMQSGTTGINTIRIYNPVKQGMDQDPEGIFVAKWVPELASLPKTYRHQPWEAPLWVGDYPKSIVDEKTARQAAQQQLWGLRKQKGHFERSQAIVKKHASRKRPQKRTQIQKKDKNLAQKSVQNLDLF